MKALGSELQVPFSCDAKPGPMVASLPILTDSSRSSVYVQVLPHRGLWRVTAVPWAMAHHCRVKIGGVTDPATSPVSSPDPRTSSSHHATTFRRAMAIGETKSVSFEKNRC